MSDEKFDDKIREAFEGHEPDVSPDWDKMKERIAAAAAIGAIGVDAAGSKIATQLSIGAAVMLGAATMWVAQQFIAPEELITEEPESFIEEIISDAAQKLVNAENEATTKDAFAEQAEQIEQAEGEVVAEVEEAAIEESVKSNNSTVDDAEPTSDHSTEVVPEDEEVEEDEAPFAVNMETSCVGAKVDFKIPESTKNDSYLWNFGDGSFSTEPNPTHQYEMPGVYDVTLSVRSQGKGSITTNTIENLITINPQPNADLDWHFQIQDKKGVITVDLIDKTAEANSSTWVIDGRILDGASAELEVPGKYEVSLIASNKYGCQDHSAANIVIGSRKELNAPGRFSPNNDGKYDTFMPFGLEKMREEWELNITDENGTEVFKSSDFNEPWNGRLPNGELAPNASKFFWQVIVIDYNGNKRIYSDIIIVER